MEDSDEVEEDGTGAGADCGEAAHSHTGRCETHAEAGEAGDTEAQRMNVSVAADADSSRPLSGIEAEIQDPPLVQDDKCCLLYFVALGDFSNH